MNLVISKCVTDVKVSKFSGHYLRNRSTLDIGVLGYIGIVWLKEHSPEVFHIPPGTPCIRNNTKTGLQQNLITNTNKVKHYNKRNRKSTLVEQVPTLQVKDKKLKERRNMAHAFNNFLTTITEKWNVQQTMQGDTISNLKDSFPGNFPRIKIISINEADIRNIIHS